MTSTDTHVADYSQKRRQTALRWIAGEGLLTSGLTESAMITAIVGLLVCDSTGRIRRQHLDSALLDPSVVQAARSILAEARTA